MHPYVHYSIIHGGQDMETTKVSFVRGWDKEDVVSVYAMVCYSAVRIDEILPSATTWMKLEDVMLSEISQSEKAKDHMILLMCGIRI